MKKKLGLLVWTAIVAAVSFTAGWKLHLDRDPNGSPRYGSLGLPANCRALIHANIDGWRSKDFDALEALGSIERNCGVVGSLWSYRPE
ncbi:hypothetical protein [Pseudomonas boanensis]|uniref:hypothetical protein n=1 Tax=Metapseudomonas boanensis TaxID=2822138 RepID=UPI0035D517F1